jgi:predicted nucleotidyltransferase
MQPADLDRHLDLARRIARELAPHPAVAAVALAGSRANVAAAIDPASDIDVYVYTREEIDAPTRRAVVEATGGATRANLGLDYWGPGDEWLHAGTGIHVDAIYFDAGWMEDQVDRVLVRHEPSLGYSTCFWHTARASTPLEDPHGWFEALQRRADVAYPEALRRAIINRNHPVLRGVLPAWANQVAKAARRGDLVSINHRLTGFLASYFDIVFAVNRLPHPGEKRLIDLAVAMCPRLPDGMASDVTEILRTATVEPGELAARLDRLCERLDDLLRTEGLLPAGAD